MRFPSPPLHFTQSQVEVAAADRPTLISASGLSKFPLLGGLNSDPPYHSALESLPAILLIWSSFICFSAGISCSTVAFFYAGTSVRTYNRTSELQRPELQTELSTRRLIWNQKHAIEQQQKLLPKKANTVQCCVKCKLSKKKKGKLKKKKNLNERSTGTVFLPCQIFW